MSKHLAHNKKKEPFGGSRFAVKQEKTDPLKRLRQVTQKDRLSFYREFSRRDVIFALCSAVCLAVSAFIHSGSTTRMILCLLSAILAAIPLVLVCVHEILDGKFPLEIIFQLFAGILALLARRYFTAGCVILFFLLSFLAQSFVQMRKENMLQTAIDLLPEKIRIQRDGVFEEAVPEDLAEGDIVQVSEGERIPVDGVIQSGTGEFETFDLDGEIGTRSFVPGDSIPAGYLLKKGAVILRASESFEKSAQATFYCQMKYAKAENIKWGRTVHIASCCLMCFLALLGLVFLVVALIKPELRQIWFSRALACFLLSAPSAILFSTEFSLADAVFSAANYGIVFAKETVIPALASVKSFVFSKTGTVTEGRYTITDIVPEKMKEEDLLRIAALAEINSIHPIAIALKRAAGLSDTIRTDVIEVEEIPGKGVNAFLGGKQVYVGNANFLEEHGIWYRVPNKTGSAIHIAIDGNYCGYIMIADKIRENAFDALEQLREQGVTSICMLTGDVRSVSRPIAASLNFDMVKPELSPEGKSASISYLRAASGDKLKIAFVGDGVHDRQAFAASDVGIAHDARAAFQDGADVSVFGTDLRKIPQAHRIAKAARMIFSINIGAALGIKILCFVLCFAGIFPFPLAAGLDALVSILGMLNCLRGFYLN